MLPFTSLPLVWLDFLLPLSVRLFIFAYVAEGAYLGLQLDIFVILLPLSVRLAIFT